MYIILLEIVGFTLLMLPGAGRAQQRPAHIFNGQVTESRKADLELQTRIDKAFSAFDELIAVTKSAAAPNSHWQVRMVSPYELSFSTQRTSTGDRVAPHIKSWPVIHSKLN